MTAEDVIAILRLFTDADLTAWVDGGWGVDALVGDVGREHSDLDLVLRADPERARDVLADAGFTRVLRDWLPTALALADAGGREIDLHPVTPTEDGGGDQPQLDGTVFHYPPPLPGVIGGVGVWCVDPATQVLCHLGYGPSAKDRHDMARLRLRFGIDLPAPYGPV
jgi:lincosamide nucleotidyltransferase A/C/D/E